MYYLIQTPYHTRPYLTTIAFLARDFRSWGCRVDTYQSESPYIAEIRYREQKLNQKEWRVELMEHWSREAIVRRQQMRQRDQERGYRTQTVSPTSDILSTENIRLERLTDSVRDFVYGLAACGKATEAHHARPADPRPLPHGPLGLVGKYMRNLHKVKYTSNADLPEWSTANFFVADQVILEFHRYEAVKQQDLTLALQKAVSKNSERIGRVVKDPNTGNLRVVLFVEVSDLVVQLESESEKIDPLPLYEKYEKCEGELPPVYAEA